MNTQSTRCAGEELAELEEWLTSRGMDYTDKDASELLPGEYTKVLAQPGAGESGAGAVWTVTWYPAPDGAPAA